jgi:hypothetical protein
MNWKGCGRNQLWANLMYPPDICLDSLRKITKGLSQGTLFLGEELTQDPLDMKQKC